MPAHQGDARRGSQFSGQASANPTFATRHLKKRNPLFSLPRDAEVFTTAVGYWLEAGLDWILGGGCGGSSSLSFLSNSRRSFSGCV